MVDPHTPRLGGLISGLSFLLKTYPNEITTALIDDVSMVVS